jgi:AraC family transcriptional regulator
MNDSTTRRLGVREIPQGSELSSYPLRSGNSISLFDHPGGSIKGLYHFQSRCHSVSVQYSCSMQGAVRIADGPHSHGTYERNNITIVPAGAEYTLDSATSSSRIGVLRVWLEPQMLHGLCGDDQDLGLTLVPRLKLRDRAIERIASVLRDECKHPNLAGPVYIESLVVELGVHLLRNYAAEVPAGAPLHLPKSGLSQSRLRQVIEYINAGLDRPLSLFDLAHVAGQSPYYFCKSFRASTGQSPHRFLLSRRIDKARQLLADRNRTISDIALECGFSSQSHMTSAFRRMRAGTPASYRPGR